MISELAPRVGLGSPRLIGDNVSMAMSSPYRVVLSDGQRRLLLARARRASGEHRDVVRARIVLATADGAANATIGRGLGVGDDTVRKWRRRFCEHGLDGLRDRPRSGRVAGLQEAREAELRFLDTFDDDHSRHRGDGSGAATAPALVGHLLAPGMTRIALAWQPRFATARLGTA
jgi:transposase-like protein